MKRII